MRRQYLLRWIEHFFILPVRWYMSHYRVWNEQRQRCKVCGCRDKFDFHMEDEVWQEVLPKKYHNRVVCLACFDDFAKKKGVDYTTSLQTLHFAGDRASFEFSISSAAQTDA